ncbi:MAG TPA: hypothetical protein VEU55_07025 [Gemmatimonadales bacterium]|nr:hypothetical protein [Gemmatimonadales bacterium]
MALAFTVGALLGVAPYRLDAQRFQGVEYLLGVSGVRGPLRGQLVVTPEVVAFENEDGTTAFALSRHVVVDVSARDSASLGSVLSLAVRDGETSGDVLFKVPGSAATDIGIALKPAPTPPSAARVRLEPHSRVRVSLPFQVYTGTVVGQDANWLRLDVPGGTPEVVTLPVADIQHLEISRPGPSQAMPGALIGLGSGAAVGVLVGGLVYLAKGLSCLDQKACNRSSPVATAALIGAGAGGIAGLVIGATMHSEEWEEVARPTRSVGRLPDGGGRFAVGLVLRF